MEQGFTSLSAGIAEIDQAVTDKTTADLVTNTGLGAVLRRILRTVYEINPDVSGTCQNCFFYGQGAPAAELGKEDDWYLQIDTGDIWAHSGASAQNTPAPIPVDIEVITEEDLENFFGSWAKTGITLKGPTGPTGLTGPAGTNGTNGASVDVRMSGTELQTKLTNQLDTSYVTRFDFADITPVVTVSPDLDLNYRLAGDAPEEAATIFDLASLTPRMRVDSNKLQWKLTVQPDTDYVDVLNLNTITPVFRIVNRDVQYKYASQADSSYTSIGELDSASQLDGDIIPVSVALSNITPDTTPEQVTAADQLGAIIKGIDNALTQAPLKMRAVQVDAAMVTARSVNFSVELRDPANAVVVLDGSFRPAGQVSVNANGVMTWAAGGAFASAITSSSYVILFSN
jgi:hypothetical protein